MGLNFRKSISLGKGLKLNLSKSGPSVSFGKSGLRQSINLKGQARTTVGIPGTGIYYTKTNNVKNLVGGLTGKDKDKPRRKSRLRALPRQRQSLHRKRITKSSSRHHRLGSRSSQQASMQSSQYISSLMVISTGKPSPTVRYQDSSRTSSLLHRAFWQATSIRISRLSLK